MELVIVMEKTSYSKVANRMIAELRDNMNEIYEAGEEYDSADQYDLVDEPNEVHNQ